MVEKTGTERTAAGRAKPRSNGDTALVRELTALGERLRKLEAHHEEHGERGREGGPAARGFCALPPVPLRELRGVHANRARLIRVHEKKWVNGTELKYYFFDRDTDGEFVTFSDGTREWRTYRGDAAQQHVVREAFATWEGTGLGLRFREVRDRSEAELRIGFMEGDGASQPVR